ncbi:MAG: 23S rRNA (adenine(1618)-N(6))-methyltransferase RlmF [Bacteriovoracaceae bacterium]|nr:23S rRNA (adenine(1618)-N(6))-methyltransferase RlmF [Bacteriovoracaceae bacterium]
MTTDTATNKKELHPRNLHNEGYDFTELIKSYPALSPFVSKNKFDNLTIDFGNDRAVIALNTALLAHYYNTTGWVIPKGHLCPPVPGRADYLHYIADLLAESNNGEVPVGPKIKGLDIGTGSSLIYPILGNSIYGWKFVGTDINSNSLSAAKSILAANSSLKKNIKCRLQKSTTDIFANIMQSDEKFDFTMCNPPFHSSLEEALESSERKLHNLSKNRQKKGTDIEGSNPSAKNFGGVKDELWCAGGELSFIKQMINQSMSVKKQCGWFTTLVSKKENIPEIIKALNKVSPAKKTTIEMKQGNKITRFIAWTFNS